MSKLYGAIEAGGTKFVCAVADEDLNILERVSIPTTVPEETMADVFKFFEKHDVVSIGIASFGPIDVNRKSKLMVISPTHLSQVGKIMISWVK